MEFANQVTVLIGRNGSGKSTLINALHKALSMVFTTVVRFKVKSLASGNPDLRVANIPPTDVWYDVSKREVAEFVSLHCEAVLNENPLKWEMKKGSSSRAGLQSTLYQKAYLLFMKEYKKTNRLPLFSYYSDSYPHIGTNIGKYAKDILNSGKPLPRNFGYYQWDAETSCTSIWELRFFKVWAEVQNIQLSKSLLKDRLDKSNEQSVSSEDASFKNTIDKKNQEVERYTNEINYILKRILKFTEADFEGANKNLSFAVTDVTMTNLFNKSRILFSFSDNMNIIMEQLPQGFKRLISIVFDISYRAYILNGDSEPNGIVLIDEIDLHLHPSLEQEVIGRFKKTFPQIQLIVSTHSPLVISNFKQDSENKIIEMIKDGDGFKNRAFPNLFGVDYSTVVRVGMGVRSSQIDIEELTNDYLFLVEKGRKDEADAVLSKITAMAGNESIYIKRIQEQLEWINS
jgi:predicted ATP-binding protein involved in virulence